VNDVVNVPIVPAPPDLHDFLARARGCLYLLVIGLFIFTVLWFYPWKRAPVL